MLLICINTFYTAIRKESIQDQISPRQCFNEFSSLEGKILSEIYLHQLLKISSLNKPNGISRFELFSFPYSMCLYYRFRFFFKNIFNFLGIPKKYTITFGVTAWRSYENGVSYCGLKAKQKDPSFRFFINIYKYKILVRFSFKYII